MNHFTLFGNCRNKARLHSDHYFREQVSITAFVRQDINITLKSEYYFAAQKNICRQEEIRYTVIMYKILQSKTS